MGKLIPIFFFFACSGTLRGRGGKGFPLRWHSEKQVFHLLRRRGGEAVAADESIDSDDEFGVFYSVYIFLGGVSQSPDTGSSVGLQRVVVNRYYC